MKQVRKYFVSALALVAVTALFIGNAQPQTPAQGKGKAAPLAANLGQLMKGIFYPNSNVIFAAQGDNPGDIPPAQDASIAVNPLESVYGQWEAVENSGLALAEASALLTLPGRKCANGRAVPTGNPDWSQFVQEMRDAGIQSYEAARSKNQDNILDAADAMAVACANCHEKYREKDDLADRCM